MKDKLYCLKEHYIQLTLFFIILVQFAFVVYMASRKESFFIDEIYSYILSNSHYADKLQNSNLLWDRWISANEWIPFITVQEGEQFDYLTVYSNNSTDAHPPLYYWCLHTVCSFFPEKFSMWFGIGLNLTFYVAVLFVVYRISKRIFHDNPYIALLPVIIYGFSPIAVDTAIFIRMYALSTLWTLLFALINLNIYQDGMSFQKVGLSFLFTFLGAMTHYFFIVFAFCVSAALCIFCLFKKYYKQLFIYGLLELVAILLLFAVYPAAITQITGSSTNGIGNTVAASFFSVDGWLNNIYVYIRSMISIWAGGLKSIMWISLIALMILVIATCYSVFLQNYYANKKGDISCGNRHMKIGGVVHHLNPRQISLYMVQFYFPH